MSTSLALIACALLFLIGYIAGYTKGQEVSDTLYKPKIKFYEDTEYLLRGIIKKYQDKFGYLGE